MSGNLRLNGGTSGYSELRAPDDAGDQVFLFPLTGGTLMTTNDIISPDGLWTRTGTTLSPSNPGDNLDGIGNITAGGYAIVTENPDNGKATGNYINEGQYVASLPANGAKSAFTGWAQDASSPERTIQIFAEGTTHIGGNLSPGNIAQNAPNIDLDASGSITAAGNVDIGSGNITLEAGGVGKFKNTISGGRLSLSSGSVLNGLGGYSNADGSAGNGSIFARNFDATGNNYVGLSTTGAANFEVKSTGTTLIGGTLPASPNITLNADGSAEFKGSIEATSGTADTACASFTNNNSNGSYPSLFLQQDNEAGNLITGRDGFNGVNTFYIRADGMLVCRGVAGKPGVSASVDDAGPPSNFYWTGSELNLYVDDVKLGAVQYTSDYRIKREIQTIDTDATSRVKALRPVSYKRADYKDLFKAKEETIEGFIAHEVQEVIPSGATGTKDCENEVQSLRLDAILAVTVKALQESVTRIEELEAKVTALES